ncbi:MAG: peptidoglycan-binding domain-containing protein, partial [Kiloniellales bacterium]|nr:peptidoglycan-binding domain-containing protein [Kiloniellales bacterium]
GLVKVTAENVLDAVEDRQKSGLKDITKDLLNFDRDKIKREILDKLASHPLYDALGDEKNKPLEEAPEAFLAGAEFEEQDDSPEEKIDFPVHEATGARLQREILEKLKASEDADSSMQAFPVNFPHLLNKQEAARPKRQKARRRSQRRSTSDESGIWRVMIAGSLVTILVSMGIIALTLMNLGGRPLFDIVFSGGQEASEQALVEVVSDPVAEGSGGGSLETEAANNASTSSSDATEGAKAPSGLAVSAQAGETSGGEKDPGEAPQQPSSGASAGEVVIDLSDVQAAALPDALPELLEDPKNIGEAVTYITQSNRAGTTYDAAIRQLFELWNVNYDSIQGPTPCLKARAAGLSCIESFGGWENIKAANRPVLVKLTDPEGRGVYAVVSEIRKGAADFHIAGYSLTGQQGDLLPFWDGSYLALDRSVYEYRADLLLGDQGEDVAWLRTQLSQLYEANLPKGNRFDRNLHDLVVRFQQDRGLLADGIVGKKTYAALLEAVKALDTPVIVQPVNSSQDTASQSNG